MTEIRFFVPGIPAPGGSKKAFCIKKGGVYTGRAAVVDAGGQRTKDWRSAVTTVAWAAMKEADLPPIIGPIELELLFQMLRPKSHFDSKGIALRSKAPSCHIIRPDCGKLARSTTDACTGICWRDDAQIVSETHDKVYSDQPGCWITVKEFQTSGGDNP